MESFHNCYKEIFGGHEVLKLYFKCSKNSISWNIRALKYPFFNKESKILVQIFHTWFLKQSIFEPSVALQKWEGMILKKRNSEVEATWASLIGWPNKTLDIPIFIITYLWNIFPYLIFVRTILRCVAAPTLNEGERSPFCSAVVVGTQWVQIGKTRQIKIQLMFYEFSLASFKRLNINSVSGHCIHMKFKICQIFAGIC